MHTYFKNFLLYGCNFFGVIVTLITTWQYAIWNPKLSFSYYFMDIVIPIIEFFVNFGIMVTTIIVIMDIVLAINKKMSYSVAITLCVINIVSIAFFLVLVHSMGRSV